MDISVSTSLSSPSRTGCCIYSKLGAEGNPKKHTEERADKKNILSSVEKGSFDSIHEGR